MKSDLNGAVATSSVNELVGTEFKSPYWLQLSAHF